MTRQVEVSLSDEVVQHTPVFPGIQRAQAQLDTLDDQLREEGASLVMRFRATDDASLARVAIGAKVREKMEEIVESEPHPAVDPASPLEDKIAHLPPSSVSIKQGPQHADLINYKPDPANPEEFAKGEFITIWNRFKAALKNPVIAGKQVTVIVTVRPGDMARFIMPSELGLQDELLSDLAEEIDLDRPVRLQALFTALKTSGKFKSQLKIDQTAAEKAKVVLSTK